MTSIRFNVGVVVERYQIKWNTLRKVFEAFIYSWYSKYRDNLILILLSCLYNPENMEKFNKSAEELLKRVVEVSVYANASGAPLWRVFRRVDPFFKGWVNIFDIIEEEVRKYAPLLKKIERKAPSPKVEGDLLEIFYPVVFHPFFCTTFVLPLFYDVLTFKVSLRFTDVLKLSSLDRETGANALKKMVGMGFLKKRGEKRAKEYFLTIEGLNNYFEVMFLEFLEYLSKEDLNEFLTLLLIWKGAINITEDGISYRILSPGELEELKKNLELKKPVELENLKVIKEAVEKYPMLRLKKSQVKPETSIYLKVLPKPPLTVKELDFLIKQAEEFKKYKERLKTIERIERKGDADILQTYEVTDELGTKHQEKEIVEFLRRKRMEIESKWNA